ncbi:MAG: hypothetical protein PHV12_04270 [Bacteroidales bacterium]|jgi:uncharacterized membrane protein YwzB|nr:hypothetical protein [Bacteroidales bacterium]MDD3272663.1 hypothetical protein [Bacteroidales bacterium]MDD4058693.1 hypothetical protein [Bacteroidales bacterium]
MIRKLINPFNYIAGAKSLLIGLAMIFITSLTGYYSNTFFPDILSVKTGVELTFKVSLLFNIVNWLSISLLLYIASLIFSKSSVRFIDLFGTQALARSPYLLAALLGFSKSINRLGEYFLWKYLSIGEPTDISSLEMTIAVVLLTLIVIISIWMITLMYNAFKVSSNIKGGKSVTIFIIVFILSIILSAFVNNLIFNTLHT